MKKVYQRTDDTQPEYAKVVNYPYSKLICYNGIRSIDIIKKIIAT